MKTICMETCCHLILHRVITDQLDQCLVTSSASTGSFQTTGNWINDNQRFIHRHPGSFKICWSRILQCKCWSGLTNIFKHITPVIVIITARAISYSFRDLSLLDIAYISCDIKEWQYSVLTSLRYVHLMQRGRKTIKIIWHSYIYSHFMPTCT